MTGWTECTADVAPGRAGAVLLDLARPLLDAARRGLFLRTVAGNGRVRLVVQARVPDHAAEPTEPAGGAAWREMAVALGREAGVDVTIGPASHEPLAGSTFAGPALAGLCRDVLARVTPGLLAGVVRRDPADRSGLLSGALELMAGHLPAVGRRTADGVPLTFLSFRSHAEAFLASSRDPAAARAAFDVRYDAVRGAVEARVADVLAEFDGAAAGDGAVGAPGGGPAEPAACWFHAARTTAPVIAGEFRRGGLRLLQDPPPEEDRDRFAESSFHSALATSPSLHEFLRDDPDFLAVRLLTSLLYLSLHDVGLTLVERYFLCHAVSRACESLFDVDAVDVLSGLAAGR